MGIYEELKFAVGENNIKRDESMSRHTTFRIGGSADFFVTPSDADSLAAVLQILKNSGTPYFIMGNGSNILVKDKGFRGAVIQIKNNFSSVKIDECTLIAGAGALLSSVAKNAANNGLTGMEFASGIPGTVGGAVYMNAGAYGGEIKDILKKITVLDGDKIKELSNDECFFGYRKSRLMEEEFIVLGAEFSLERGDKDIINAQMAEFNQRRIQKQPIEFPSAGSTFKRPLNGFAAKLIEDCGLKGFSVGQAQVSPKHSGFVVNNGGATASDVLSLMEYIEKTVFSKTGVMLEPEVRIIGE
ncbi:MAG TPA: UDP-N-acetylenolpyruvoylglucosamine reductase [Lachnospiraceae bacterium]|nr:UDP-N-acetylenolpyruvoylglucosamine reductase [Lachnospiraceae bacterium]